MVISAHLAVQSSVHKSEALLSHSQLLIAFPSYLLESLRVLGSLALAEGCPAQHFRNGKPG
jgi:hypothetical protein